jgi:histone acetyltransferase SAS3
VQTTLSFARLILETRFCYEDEENDPSEEYEEYLACEVCGDNCKLRLKNLSFSHSLTAAPAAHRQCARNNNALKSDEGKLLLD